MSRIVTPQDPLNWCGKELKWPLSCETGPGLHGLIAAVSPVAWINEEGRTLEYRGIRIEELLHHPDFEYGSHLLIYGGEKEQGQLDSFRRKIRSSRSLPASIESILKCASIDAHPTQMLRAGVSAMGCFELRRDADLSGSESWEELRILGQVAALAGLITTMKKNKPAVVIPDELSLAEGLLFQLHQEKPAPEEAELLNLLWILYADHGLDAPTFTGMIVGSCHADPYYNVVAGLSALHGDRLGRAGERLLTRVVSFHSDSEAINWVNHTLDNEEHIPGFGNRVNHFPDPRSQILREKLENWISEKYQLDLFKRFERIESVASQRLNDKGIYVNLNFYSSLLLYLLGFPAEMIAPVFMIGRMAGLIARVKDYLENGGRLYRPQCRYTGRSEYEGESLP